MVYLNLYANDFKINISADLRNAYKYVDGEFPHQTLLKYHMQFSKSADMTLIEIDI